MASFVMVQLVDAAEKEANGFGLDSCGTGRGTCLGFPGGVVVVVLGLEGCVGCCRGILARWCNVWWLVLTG